MLRRPLIAGNWKMNGLLDDNPIANLVKLVNQRKDWPFEMVICPPFTLLQHVNESIVNSGILLGAQDCHMKDEGAYTGDVSPVMLHDIGCTYVIIGHSERRIWHNESNAVIKDKVSAALRADLRVILCIGETENERQDGKTMVVNKIQLKESLLNTVVDSNTLVIAYEPVWAIGTGKTPTSSEIQEVHALIRGELSYLISHKEAEKVRILYGGSMKPSNAREILALPDVDGGLIGGASLKSADFWEIAQSCL